MLFFFTLPQMFLQALAFHVHFARNVLTATRVYALGQAANAAPALLGVINVPARWVLGRALLEVQAPVRGAAPDTTGAAAFEVAAAAS